MSIVGNRLAHLPSQVCHRCRQIFPWAGISLIRPICRCHPTVMDPTSRCRTIRRPIICRTTILRPRHQHHHIRCLTISHICVSSIVPLGRLHRQPIHLNLFRLLSIQAVMQITARHHRMRLLLVLPVAEGPLRNSHTLLVGHNRH